MRYCVLATDYDGTIAHDGAVDDKTIDSLRKLRDAGRKLILVTGRQLPDLMDNFSELGYFERVVAENGALVYDPSTKKEHVLAEPPCDAFVQALQRRAVEPLAVGRVIVATWDSQKEKVLDALHEEGLECQIIFNKGALMVLPSGVNKAFGLDAALNQLCLSRHNSVGIGDAENDHAFLSACEAAVAVANALPSLKERADLVTEGSRGQGVQELIAKILEDDLASIASQLSRHDILIGSHEGGDVLIPAYGTSFMVAGTSGGGKSTLTTGFMERLHERGYQFCTIDPEGDYESFPGAVVVGDTKRAAPVPEVLQLLEKPDQSVIVNLLGVALEQRPMYFQGLLPELMALRARTGRPHWIIVDEAHHVLPADRSADVVMPKEFSSFMLITMEPDHVDKAAVQSVDEIIAVGGSPTDTIAKFCEVCGGRAPGGQAGPLEKGKALLWSRHRGGEPLRFDVARSTLVSERHSRKYATAELTPDRSFFFKGPEGKLNLRAQNLMSFVQLMEGVDDETWLHHFHKGEYSQWFRENIKSKDLAEAAEKIEEQRELSAEESRKLMRDEIEQRYTLPA